jgi:hypothetical protein
MKGFRLKEVCTTEKGARYVATTYACDERYGLETHEYYGIRLMPEDYSSDEVVVSENRLFLGGFEVMDYPTDTEIWSSLSNQIPRYYVIRKYDKDRGYNSFQGGFDLLNDGRAWEGITRTEYDTIADALRFIRERVGDDFSIWLEEPMQL